MRKAKILVFAAAFLLLLVLAYGHFIEPGWIRVRKTEVRIASGQAPAFTLTVAHLTDFHLSPAVSLDYLRGVFRETAAQRPDIICLTGDYISKRMSRKAEYIDALKILTSAAPTFACPGNHDGGAWAIKMGGYPDLGEIKSVLSQAHVVYLENASTALTLRGHRILVGGLGDIWAGRCEPESLRAVFDSTQADLKIILTHNPDSKSETRNLKWDLLLAGHTHGGQLYLPWIGAPFAPIVDKHFLNGLYEYAGGKIYVSPGVGNLHGMRINCRPEISILEIRK